MHFDAFLLSLLPAFSTVTSECYGSGTTWGIDKNTVVKAVGAWCGPHSLAGYFNEGRTKYKWVNAGTRRVNFVAGWRSHGGHTLSSNGCWQKLNNEIPEL